MSIGDVAKKARPWDGHERRHGRDDDYSGPERRRQPDAARPVRESDLDVAAMLGRFAAIEARLDKGADRMANIEADLRANTATTQATAAATAAHTTLLQEVRDLLELGRAAFRLLDILGRSFKWVGGLATAGLALWGAIYTAMHGGKPPGS